ncbi:MAG: fumarylacetoacetate hydrolase family protein [Gammaproteobacteria bacterium]
MAQETNGFAVSPPALPTIPVVGQSELFPVRRIYCVGQNYADHTREMGGDSSREPPFFFSKPADAVRVSPAEVPYPPETGNLHHEVELVIALASGGGNIDPAAALQWVFGYGVGIDLTRRDMQAAAKKAGRPWDMAKGFDASAPISNLMPAGRVGAIRNQSISLQVNGDLRQSGQVGAMIWSVPEIIAQLSRLVELKAGDLIFTGTPAGVGPVRPGDTLYAEIDGVGSLEVRITVPTR